jgi:hypothetical protein
VDLVVLRAAQADGNSTGPNPHQCPRMLAVSS